MTAHPDMNCTTKNRFWEWFGKKYQWSLKQLYINIIFIICYNISFLKDISIPFDTFLIYNLFPFGSTSMAFLSSSILLLTAWNVTKYGVFSGPDFPAFRLYTERYSVSLRIQYKCRKIRNRKSSVFGHFSHSDYHSNSFYRLITCIIIQALIRVARLFLGKSTQKKVKTKN